MAGDTTLTIIGNVTGDPELRFTPSGAAVANFSVASTPRSFDRQTNEWKDGETLFMRCSIWRDAAENVAETLQKGMRVIVSGRLKQRSYDKDGQTRTVIEMEVDEVGPSLRYASAQVKKTERTQQPQGGQQGGWGGQPQGQQGWGGQQGGYVSPQGDPWATSPQTEQVQQRPAQQGQQGNQGGGWNANPSGGQGPGYDEPPY